MDNLIAAAVQAAVSLAPRVLEDTAANIRHYTQPEFGVRSNLAANTPPAAIEILKPLLDAWADTGVHGEVVAETLRAAAATADQMRTEQHVDLVWTGPKTTAVNARTTREALLEVINAADHQLTLFSYAGRQVPDVVAAILTDVERHVDVRMVLETSKDSQGSLTHDAAEAFTDLAGKCAFYIWPLEQRQEHSDKSASMHVKAALADDHTALITSANLTGAALLRNMELGLLVKRGPVPAALAAHVDALIDRDELQRV